MNYVGAEPAPSGVILVGDTNPVGLIGWFHGVPDATWLRLNGQIVSKTAYPDLWNYANNGGFLTTDQVANAGLYKSIDAATFALPKLDGYFIRALGSWDANRASAALGAGQGDANKSHTHVPISSATVLQNTGTASAGLGPTSGSWGGMVLTSDGASEARPLNVALVPCVKALKTILVPQVGGMPAMDVIADMTLTNGQATADFPLVGYVAYRFIFDRVAPVTDAVSLYSRVSTNGGASFDAGNNYGSASQGLQVNGTGGTGGGNSGVGQFYLHHAVAQSNDANNGLNGEMLINSPILKFTYTAHIGAYFTTGLHGFADSYGIYQPASPTNVNAMRFFFNTGNFRSGRIVLYGLRGLS